MTEQERALFEQALGDVAILKIEVAALQELTVALAIALAKSPNPALPEVVTTLGFARLMARWEKGADVADGMRYVIDRLHALQANPLTGLLATALLHRSAGDSLREPLESWLSQASVDEISADLQQALRKLIDEARLHDGGDESLGV